MVKRIKPPFLGAQGKIKKSAKAIKLQTGPSLNRLTVLWVNNAGIPYDTRGFNAALYRGRTLVQTARFDGFGAVYFSRITPLTTTAYTLRVYDQSGRIYHTRTIPSGVQAIAVIG